MLIKDESLCKVISSLEVSIEYLQNRIIDLRNIYLHEKETHNECVELYNSLCELYNSYQYDYEEMYGYFYKISELQGEGFTRKVIYENDEVDKKEINPFAQVPKELDEDNPFKENKYYKPYLKALREDVEASKKKDGIKENKELKKMIDSGYDLFKLSTEQ